MDLLSLMRELEQLTKNDYLEISREYHALKTNCEEAKKKLSSIKAAIIRLGETKSSAEKCGTRRRSVMFRSSATC